jgi:hypothetical protein
MPGDGRTDLAGDNNRQEIGGLACVLKGTTPAVQIIPCGCLLGKGREMDKVLGIGMIFSLLFILGCSNRDCTTKDGRACTARMAGNFACASYLFKCKPIKEHSEYVKQTALNRSFYLIKSDMDQNQIIFTMKAIVQVNDALIAYSSSLPGMEKKTFLGLLPEVNKIIDKVYKEEKPVGQDAGYSDESKKFMNIMLVDLDKIFEEHSEWWQLSTEIFSLASSFFYGVSSELRSEYYR